MDKKKRFNLNIDHGGHVFFTDNVTISHGPNKFVMDFSQTAPRFDNLHGQMQQTMAIRHNTVMMDPRMAKIFLRTLGDNLKKYEKNYGKMKLPKNKKGKPKLNGKKISHAESSRYIG